MCYGGAGRGGHVDREVGIPEKSAWATNSAEILLELLSPSVSGIHSSFYISDVPFGGEKVPRVYESKPQNNLLAHDTI